MDSDSKLLIGQNGLINLSELEMDMVKDVHLYYDGGGRCDGIKKMIEPGNVVTADFQRCRQR